MILRVSFGNKLLLKLNKIAQIWYKKINFKTPPVTWLPSFLGLRGLTHFTISWGLGSRKSLHLDRDSIMVYTVYPKKYALGFCFAVLCCGYTLTDFPISIRLTSLALWQSNDCPNASKATLMDMDKYFMWIHYERLHNHNKAKHNKTVCIFLGIYCNTELSGEEATYKIRHNCLNHYRG